MAKSKEKSPIKVKSKIFYPSHGAGTVIKQKKIEFDGEEKKYYEFSFINKKLTISAPVENLEMLGIRPVNDIKDIRKSVKVLKKKPSVKPKSTEYSDLINSIKELEEKGDVDSYIRIIQYCNHEKKVREKEGRLIPIGIVKHIKNSVTNIVGEMAVSDGVDFDDALKTFEKDSGMEIEL